MTNMVEGNITNQYPLTKIRNYYRMGDGILDGYPIIQDQTSPNIAHIPTTNLVTYSEDLTNTFYNSSGLETVTESTTLSPDGVSYGYNITPTSATSSHYFDFQYLQLTTTVGTEIAFSVFVKPNGYNFIQIASSTGFAAKYQNFELTSGGIIGNGDINSSKIEKIGDWYRCSVTQDATGTNPRFLLITSQTALASRNPSFAGNGTDGILAWGYQVEEQSQATAYIKSDGIAAVRKSSTTNLLNYSEDFSSATASNSVLTANQLDFNNTYNAYSLTENTSNSEHYVELASMSQTTNNTLTSSIYIKANGRTKVILWNYYLSNQRAKVEFDLSNNTISNSGATNVTFVSANIEDYNTEWKRISITSVKTASNYAYKIRLNILNDSGSDSYVGDGTSGVFIYAAQMEEQTQAETYAKTTGLPVTIDLFTENNYGTMTNMSASDIIEDTPNN